MRRAILLLAFCGVASAQLTTVQGLIQLATGATPSGTLTLANQYFVSPSGAVVPAASIVVPIVNGVINPPSGIPIFPNVGSTPSGTSYSATYALSGLPVYQRKWYVPQSNTPVNVVNVEYPSQGNVGQSAIINPVQIVPAGAVPGNCLVFNGNLWLPGTCSGGGASSAFNTITSGTNTTAAMLVGTGASLGFTGSGTVAANTILTTPITALRGNSGILAQATGAFTSGNLRSSDASSNEIDSGIPGANVIVSTGAYANPSWITSLAASKITGGFGCSAMPALTGDVGSSAGSCVVTVVATNGNPFAQSAIINALNASNISSGTLAAARLPAINLAASGAGGVTGNLPVTNLNGGTGASSTTAWFGDGTWKSIAAGGTVTNSLGPLTAGAVVIGNSGNDETVLPSLGTTTTVLHGNAGGNPSWGSVVLTTDVSGVLPGANGGLGTASIIFSGPSGTAKTFTLPNASSTILTSNAAVTLAQGGNGANFSAIALGGLLTGTGSGTLGILAASTNGFVLTLDSAQANGMKWASPTTGGTVTSVATTGPITGGTFTTSGTIACPTCTTSASALTSNQLVIGAGSQAEQTLGSLGTTTTVLHGNNAGPPSFAAVSLTADVSGVLPYANGGFGSATGTQTQFLRIQPNTGNNSTLQFNSFQTATAPDYNWPAQTPGGTLSIGSNTITLSPMPLGMGSTSVGQYVYITAGTGTAEAVPITAWTSSTITITCAGTHSGAWTVMSATGGGAEAFTGGARSIYFPSANPATFYGPLVIPGTVAVSFYGDSFWSPAIIRGSGNTTNDLFYAPGATNYTQFAYLSFFNLAVTNGPGTTGRVIHSIWGSVHIESMYVTDGIFVDHDSTQNSSINDFLYFSTGAVSSVFIYRATSDIVVNPGIASATNSSMSNGSIIDGSTTGNGILVTGADVLNISNVVPDGLGVGLFMQPDTGAYISNVYVNNCKFDAGGPTTAAFEAIAMDGRSGSNFGNVFITNSTFGGENNAGTNYAIDFQQNEVVGAQFGTITITGNLIQGWGFGGIASQQLSGAGDMRMIIANNTITGNNTRSKPTNSGGIYVEYPQGITIADNIISGNTGYGIYWTGASASGPIQITGAAIAANSTGAIFTDSAIPSGTIISNIHNVTDGLPAVASATTLVFPLGAPNFTITGTTNMTAATITGVAPNSSGTFRCTGGSPTITSGSGWGNSGTCTSGVLFNWFSDGTNIWWK